MFPLRSIVFPSLLAMFTIMGKFPEISKFMEISRNFKIYGNFHLVLNFRKIYKPSNKHMWPPLQPGTVSIVK